MLGNSKRRVWCVLLLICPAAGAASAAMSPSFTPSQVAAGRVAYARACGNCHGTALQGAAAVALSGSAFALTWGDGRHQGADFFDAIAKQMPKNLPGSLSEADNLAIAAFILDRNGYPTGTQPLTVAGLTVALAVSPHATAAVASSAAGVFPQP